MEVYDAKLDPEFSKGYIDVDEMRVRVLDDGTEIPFRFMHGGFAGTDVKFTFSFPEKENYEGRFYQYLSPFPGPDEEMASVPVNGVDDKIAFCLTHGAYYVESNMGSKQMHAMTSDNTLTHRASAAAAEFSRVKAQEIYNYEHRPYGYVYGGSGGGFRTMACIENTNAFDGAAPYIIGSPYAIPNCQSTRALAERVLRHKLPQIVEAFDAGGNKDPESFLNEEEAKAFREARLLGYPDKSWFASMDGNTGALPVLLPGVKAMDPSYFEEFWTLPGYAGTNEQETALRDRIFMEVTVKKSSYQETEAKQEKTKIDTRNGADNAWKKMIASEAENVNPWIELDRVPEGDDLYLSGTRFKIHSGEAAGRELEVKKIEGNRIYLTDGFGTSPIRETLELLAEGDEALMDNSDFIAMGYYHRYQVPSSDYTAWDQFRDEKGEPIYPQRTMLVGPIFSGGGPGCKQNGLINGKVIVVASLMDEQAYPWQPDWYRRKIASVHDGNDSDYMRLWYFDYSLHNDETKSIDELHATSYMGGLKQALIDLAAWVEKGEEPLASTNYQMDGGHVIVADTAKERGGLQPVAHVFANGSTCTEAAAGEEIQFTVEGEVPDNAGKLTFVEWSFEGEQDFPVKSEWNLSDNGTRGTSSVVHTYKEPGTYYAVVRIMSERNGDKTEPFTQVRNIERVKIIVK